MSKIIEPRVVYKPFEYQEAADYWLKQQQAHWIHTEVPMMSDLADWNSNLNETEKNIIGSILKGFAQTETVVNDYWTQLVTKWFRKPEIIAMATTFGAFETIHAEAYSLLNETLGLDNFDEFMEDEATMAKIEALTSIRDSFSGETDWHEVAKSLAIFSAFTEGVNLFSSFAVLLSFKMRNKLKGVGQIVEWSIRDESLHSEAGCWLFRTLIKENPELKTPELEAAINEAALLSLQLELNFIKKCYELGDLEGCSQYDLEHFIKNRVNTKLADLGYKGIISEIDMTAVERMKWFDHLSGGKQHTDFFANRVTNYSKGNMNWDESIF
jgi:ribonucleoside-diphosphate reductase beta chain|tara:strand:- start:298 stop:1275 length:978 start_codon:yes stop_codon:yes gene_type:complete